MKIIDMHCHIFPEKIAQKAAAAIGSFYSITMAHDGTRERLISSCKENGIVRALIHSVASNASQVEKINDYIASSKEECPELFTGFATMHPDYENIAAEIKRAREMGLKGIKIHPDMQHFAIDDRRAYPIYEEIAGKMPIQVHTGDPRHNYSHPYMMAKVMKDFPSLTVIGAHFGGWSEWREAKECYKGLDNLYIDTSSSLYQIPADEAAALIRAYGVSRCFFGTDYPMWSAKEEIERFMSLPLTDGEREAVLYKNAEDFLNNLA
ncbi:MAG: amidohydrolase [Clostridia bacterium]|nr:amidohydrolase [Clostridia bacterium]